MVITCIYELTFGSDFCADNHAAESSAGKTPIPCIEMGMLLNSVTAGMLGEFIREMC